MREIRAILVKVKILLNMKNFLILHAKNFPAKILLNKKFFDFCKIFRQYEKNFDIKFLKILLETDNFLFNKISGQSTNVGVSLCRGQMWPSMSGNLEKTKIIPPIVMKLTSNHFGGL